MYTLYISKESIEKSISYFKSLHVQNHMPLSLFFFFKRHGINTSKGIYPTNYKNDGLRTLYLLGGIFDEDESPGKYTCLTPFAFSDSVASGNFYNGGTAFKGLLGRIKDTVDNTLIDYYLNRQFDKSSNSNKYSLKSGYLATVKSYLPGTDRISLSHFAAWIFKFVKFEVPKDWFDDPNSFCKEFTRVCVKKLLDDFKIGKLEKAELFKDSGFLITPSKHRVSGFFLRSKFNFSGNQPEIIKGGNQKMKESINEKMELNEVMNASIPKGKNILAIELFKMLKNHKQAILFGPPGTGKTWMAKQMKSFYISNFYLIQFHPSTSYEEFIGGIIYDPLDGKLKAEKGCLLEWCLKADKDPENNYLLVIDEINRGNIAKVFGEAIIALDRDYEAQLLFKMKNDNGGEKRIKLKIPRNLHILGTMNSADRSIALVDYALRRRFIFIRYYPNYEVVKDMADESELQEIDVSALLEAINQKLFDVLKDEDLLLGHSYFLPGWAEKDGRIIWNKEVLWEVFNYSILPMLEEYTYGKKSILENIIGPSLCERISDPIKFLSELLRQFPTSAKET